MAEEEFTRRLAAIVVADVAGYSRLVAADEEGTFAALRSLRREIIDPNLVRYHGRVANTAGDSLLIEFPSVVDALRCAAEIQRAIAARNRAVADEERIRFRIGVNVGDVMEQEGDLLGDGVNIAARLQELAEPGGIYLTARAREDVGDRLDVLFEDLGEHALKNIARPVRIFRVFHDDAGKPAASQGKARRLLPMRLAIAGAILAIAIAGSGAWWWQSRTASSTTTQTSELPLPDRPSIAVLPFQDLSGDPEQEYFADGMTADLITGLSKISGLFVIARNSSFVYKGKAVDVKTVGRELGVKYVLEGSVRRVGEQVRINAQLIDATTGGHVWAERFDQTSGDVFGLQDDVTRRVISALAVTLTSSERRRVGQNETGSFEAYEAFLRGREHYRRFTPEDFAVARDFFERAVALDPEYGRAYAALALVHFRAFELGWARALGMGWNVAQLRAGTYLQRAWQNPTPLAHRVASDMYLRVRRTDDAHVAATQALALEPNDPESHVAVAKSLIFMGRAPDAIGHIEEAMRLDAFFPSEYLYLLGLANFGMERFDEAAKSFNQALARTPTNSRIRAPLAASYVYLDRPDDAQRVIAPYMQDVNLASVDGSWTEEALRLRWPYTREEDWARFATALAEASGRTLRPVPETPGGELWENRRRLVRTSSRARQPNS